MATATAQDGVTDLLGFLEVLEGLKTEEIDLNGTTTTAAFAFEGIGYVATGTNFTLGAVDLGEDELTPDRLATGTINSFVSDLDGYSVTGLNLEVSNLNLALASSSSTAITSLLSGLAWTITGTESANTAGQGKLTGTVTWDLLGGNDTVNGSAGIDTMNGGEGNDILKSLGNNDTLNGGNGDDTLDGGVGNDRMNGDAGADTFISGSGDDDLYGGTGNDIFRLTSSSNNSQIDGGEEAGDLDIVQVEVSRSISLADLTGIETLKTSRSVTLVGTAEIESGDLQAGGLGFLIQGVTGFKWGDANDNITGGLSTGETQDGGNGNDTLNGSGGNDRLFGASGADTLGGGTDNDFLYGGSGNDSVDGGDGNDFLDGGVGTNTLYGGLGEDTFRIGTSSGIDTIFGGNGTGETDVVEVTVSRSVLASRFKEIEQLKTTKSVTLRGEDAADKVDIDDTNTTGDFTFDINGVKRFDWRGGNDVITGLDTEDTHLGGSGNDTIDGAGGNDVLRGGKGADSVTGGTGDDIFVFASRGDIATGTARDRIGSFNVADDRIDLRALDLTWTERSFGTTSEKFVRYDATNDRLLIDVDRDTGAEYIIELDGNIALERNDLML